MSKSVNYFLATTIAFLFIAGTITSTYLYATNFDIENFFSSFQLSIYGKVGIILAFYVVRNYLFVPSTLIIILYSYAGLQAEKYMSYFFYFIGFFVILFMGWWLLKKRKIIH